MQNQDATLSAVRTDVARVSGEVADLKEKVADHGRTLAGHEAAIDQAREKLGRLEGRYVSLKECVIRIEGTLESLDLVIASLNRNVEDIKGWLMKLLFLAFVALIVMALGSKAAEVFNLGVL